MGSILFYFGRTKTGVGSQGLTKFLILRKAVGVAVTPFRTPVARVNIRQRGPEDMRASPGVNNLNFVSAPFLSICLSVAPATAIAAGVGHSSGL
jgi:hypothetical protein